VQRRMEVAARKEAGYKKATGFSCFLFFSSCVCDARGRGRGREAELLRTPFWAHR
jgi:hypothetical protein